MRSTTRPALNPALSRRTLLAIAGALALGRSVPAAAQTPTVSWPPFPERSRRLFAVAPARELSAVPIPFYHADLARQLASLGIDQPDPDRIPDALPDGFVRATYALPLAAVAFRKALQPAWFDTFGFSPFAVEQAMTLSVPPTLSLSSPAVSMHRRSRPR